MFPCATGSRNTVFSQADPEGWVALLRSCHQDFRGGHESDGDALHTFAHILSDVAAIYPANGGQPIWQRLFEQDIIPVVVRLLCDFDFDADIDRQGLDTTVSRIKSSSFSARLTARPRHSETICQIFARYLPHLLDNYPLFYRGRGTKNATLVQRPTVPVALLLITPSMPSQLRTLQSFRLSATSGITGHHCWSAIVRRCSGGIIATSLPWGMACMGQCVSWLTSCIVMHRRLPGRE